MKPLRADLTDARLLAAAGSDPAAFACFYDRYEKPIAGFFMRRTRDPELVADLTAEVFAAALGSSSRYRPEGPTAATWLFTIASNTLSRSLRRGRVEAKARNRLGMQTVALSDNSLERVALGGDAWVTELLDLLPSEQRNAIRARVLDDRPYREIATELKTSELVIRKRVSRGLTTLRARLEASTAVGIENSLK